MSAVNRYLGAKIYAVHFAHGLLALAGFAFVVAHIPLLATVALTPLILLCGLFWLYTARIVLPIANRLWRGEPLRLAHATSGATNLDEESNG